MNEATPSRFETDYVDDLEDTIFDYDVWTCVKCNKDFIDPEDFPIAAPTIAEQVERRLYWLSPTESVCYKCACLAGIPPIDEEDNG